jgi:phosphoglycolate phosphatase-like HAD superfamily hydrolase
MKNPRSIFFDLDGTLLDGSGLRQSIARTCARIADGRPDLDATVLVEANGNVWQSYWPEVEASWNLGGMSGASVSLEVWRSTLRACGCSDESVARLALETHLQHEREAHRLFDDVRDALERLRRARCRSRRG